MDNIGMVSLDNKSTTVSYTFINQIFEICEDGPVSRAFLMGVDIGNTVVLEEPDGNKVKLVIIDINMGPVAKWRAIIKR
jgi:hypothetical protein